MSIVQYNQLHWEKIHYVPKQLEMNSSSLSTNRNSRHTQVTVPRSATSTRFEYLMGHRLPVLQMNHKLPVLQIYHNLPVLPTYRKLKLHHVTYQIFMGFANHTVTTGGILIPHVIS